MDLAAATLLPAPLELQSCCWTGRFAQFLPMQTMRSIHCSFGAAAKVQGVRGFWLRSATLCSLSLSIDATSGDCTMSVFMKGQLHWQCSMTATAAQCSLLTPQQTQQGWVIAVATSGKTASSPDQEISSKCCFCFEEDAQGCADLLQSVREKHANTNMEAAAWQKEVAATEYTPAAAGSTEATQPGSQEDAFEPAPALHTAVETAEGTAATTGQAATAAHATDAELLAIMQGCLADPGFRRLVDRVEALWNGLDLGAAAS